jgi:hypothetical protein
MNVFKQILVCACVVLFTVLYLAHSAFAAVWNGIVPLKTSREEVGKILGAPIETPKEENAPLRFKVLGGTVTIAFVDEKFATKNKLPKEVVGKVRQIVLQHENSSATPESMGLDKKRDFVKNVNRKVMVYSNEKDGVMYTFIDGTLKTTYYVASAAQISKSDKYWVF